MKNVKEVLDLSAGHLEKSGVVDSRLQAEHLLSQALQMKRLQLYTDFQRPLSEGELEECRGLLGRRSRREPLAYIAGEVEFYDCRITVDRSVLIPRQETELLVERVIKELEQRDLSDATLWDLCTGSGCIGIALKKRFPELTVVMSDLSKDALATAKANAELNGIEVRCLEGDLLAAMPDEKVEYLVCNPPYVTEAEYSSLENEVREWEPKMALVGGESGLEFYRRLAQGLPDVLADGGLAWMELGTGQGSEVKKLFGGSPWKGSEVGQDYAGHDRFFFLAKE